MMSANPVPPPSRQDVAILGGGAAGMAAAIFTQEEAIAVLGRPLRILILEGAKKPGAKILVSGGGRCNVTHREVTENDYFGGNPRIIRNVLRAFPVEATLQWMDDLGVPLKLEETGKWFPASDKARTVLDALMRRLEALGVEWATGVRATDLERDDGGWAVRCGDGTTRHATRLVVATGGMALPKSGSDGWGLRMMESLGHSIVRPRPALAPVLAHLQHGTANPQADSAALSGLSAHLAVSALDGPRTAASFTGSTLFTHFGLSGPAPMNISRFLDPQGAPENQGPAVALAIPALADPAAAEAFLLQQGRSHPARAVATVLQGHLPERLARWWAGELADLRIGHLQRNQRQALRQRISGLRIPSAGTRGFTFAETTAGGVALEEIDHRTMASRILPAVHLIGEILDVDGRIGGFNFQWAWASAKVAARGLVASIHRA